MTRGVNSTALKAGSDATAFKIGVDATALVDLHSGAARRIIQLWSQVLERVHRDPLELNLEVAVLVRPSLAKRVAEQLPRARVIEITPARGPLDRWLRWGRTLRRVMRAEGLEFLFQDPRPLAWPEKTIPTVHDLRSLDKRFSSLPRRLYARIWAGRELRRCPAVISVSRHVAEELKRRYQLPAARVAIIRNGVKARAFEAARDLPRELASRLGDRPFLLAVGHREPRKNLPFAIRLLPLLKAAGLDFQLAIAGRKVPGYGEPEALVRKLGIEPDVLFLGDVPEDSLCALYQRARALVFPSLLEGFGIPLLEAMAASCPAFVLDRAPFDEIAPEGSRLPLDLDSWVKRLITLEKDPKARDELIAAGRIRAVCYDWDGPASLMVDLLAELKAETCS
ncbi:MAG: glycosyltransferase family 1 protein [Planctomycetota bacterium]